MPAGVWRQSPSTVIQFNSIQFINKETKVLWLHRIPVSLVVEDQDHRLANSVWARLQPGSTKDNFTPTVTKRNRLAMFFEPSRMFAPNVILIRSAVLAQCSRVSRVPDRQTYGEADRQTELQWQ